MGHVTRHTSDSVEHTTLDRETRAAFVTQLHPINNNNRSSIALWRERVGSGYLSEVDSGERERELRDLRQRAASRSPSACLASLPRVAACCEVGETCPVAFLDPSYQQPSGTESRAAGPCAAGPQAAAASSLVTQLFSTRTHPIARSERPCLHMMRDQSFHSTPIESAISRSGFLIPANPNSPGFESVLSSSRSTRSSSRSIERSWSTNISLT